MARMLEQQGRDSAAMAAGALLAWWREAGADCLVAPTPRPWIAAPSAAPPAAAVAAPRARAVAGAGAAVAETGAVRFRTLAELAAHVGETAPGAPLADGNPGSGLVILGEAPSAEDLRTGRPFSGPAGQLLDRMLAAIGIDRGSCYVTLLAPRAGVPGPPDARAIAADLPLTIEHLRLLAPRLLLLLGAIPAQTLIGERLPIGKLRGRVFRLTPGGHEVEALASFNPAYLLRQPAAKREAWRDLLLLKRRLGR